MAGDAPELLARLERSGVSQVRVDLENGIFQGSKVARVREWLRERESAPTTARRQPGTNAAGKYKPTRGDLAFSAAHAGAAEPNPFEEAILLRNLSDAYLSVLISDNAGPTSAGYKALLDAEMTRRGALVARRANLIALGSLVVAIAAAVISVIAMMATP